MFAAHATPCESFTTAFTTFTTATLQVFTTATLALKAMSNQLQPLRKSTTLEPVVHLPLYCG